MGLGVIVAGLGIGALVAVLMQRNAGTVPPAAVVISTPAPALTPGRGPIAIATIEPPRTPRPSPSPAPAPSPEQSLEPTARPSPGPTFSAAKPARAALAVPTPVATVAGERAAAAPAPNVSPSQEPLDIAPSPTPVAADEPPAAPVVTPAAPVVTPAATSGTPSAYDQHASAVVRRYLAALIRGDERTAYSALGGSGGTLSERSFLDPGARIVSVKVIHIDASNASVGCEIASEKGRYYATYHVTAASSGPYISQHDFIKV